MGENVSHLSLEEKSAVTDKLTHHIQRRDELEVEKTKNATAFTKRIKEETGIIKDLCEQLQGTADQPSLPGTHMDVEDDPPPGHSDPGDPPFPEEDTPEPGNVA